MPGGALSITVSYMPRRTITAPLATAPPGLMERRGGVGVTGERLGRAGRCAVDYGVVYAPPNDHGAHRHRAVGQALGDDHQVGHDADRLCRDTRAGAAGA